MTIPYEIWDVFTDATLAGNPLAVVFEAETLDEGAMLALAREFNLSETAFVLPSETCAARARYFTPARELPMAGHPTIGTAFALDARGALPGAEAALQLAIGPIPLRLEREGGRLRRVWMDQGVPRRLAAFDDAASRRELAGALGLEPRELRADLPPTVASAGVPFLLVALADVGALGRASLEPSRLPAALDAEHRSVLAFVLGDGEPRVRCRMFGAAVGVHEDPATGSAHGPLGAYLAWHGLCDPSAGPRTFTSRQGVEMLRPSTLSVRVRLEGGAPAVEVGGHAVRLAAGALEL